MIVLDIKLRERVIFEGVYLEREARNHLDLLINFIFYHIISIVLIKVKVLPVSMRLPEITISNT